MPQDNICNNDVVYIRFGNLYFSRAVSFTGSNVSISRFIPTLDQSPDDRVPFLVQKSSWDIGTSFNSHDPLVIGDFFSLWALDEGLPQHIRYLVPCDDFTTYTYTSTITRLTFSDNTTDFARFWSIVPLGIACSGVPMVSEKKYSIYSATDFRQVIGRNFDSLIVEMENTVSASTDNDVRLNSCDTNSTENYSLQFEKINLTNTANW